MRYQNPVLPGFHPDPSLCRVGKDYYLATSSFEYFPGVPLFHSRDLVHWRKIGHCLTRPGQARLKDAHASGGVYAPTLRHHQGVFYMVTTNVSAGGNFLVTASSPEGPWSDPLPIAQEGIDPSLFFDDDGSVYFTTSRDGACQSLLDIRTGKLLSEPKVVWAGTGGQYPEGPHLYKKDGWYYLLLAEGGTEYGHMATMARSRGPWGPFEPAPRNPLLTHRSLRSPIQVLGHADLVETAEGSWFAVFLGVRPNGYPPCYHLGRETFLAPVSWAGDGFPVFGDEGRVSLEMGSSLAPSPFPAAAPRDDFDGPELGLNWSYLREPVPSLYSLSERPGFLRLKGSAAGLDDLASPAWVGRPQCHFDMRASTRLEFHPGTEREEAGLTVRMNEGHHYEIFLALRKGVPSVVVRRRIGSLQAETASRALPAGGDKSWVLAVGSDKDRYLFLEGPSEDKLQTLGEGETRYLSTETAGGFTGVHLALYASGGGKPCVAPADFDWFEYRA